MLQVERSQVNEDAEQGLTENLKTKAISARLLNIIPAIDPDNFKDPLSELTGAVSDLVDPVADLADPVSDLDELPEDFDASVEAILALCNPAVDITCELAHTEGVCEYVIPYGGIKQVMRCYCQRSDIFNFDI